MKSPALLWLRRDLRLHDHPALHAAASRHQAVLPVYCLDPREFRTSRWGFPKTGSHRARFLLECLHDLRQSLHARGSGLLVLLGKPEELLPPLVRRYEVGALYFTREVTREECDVEQALREALPPGVAWHPCDGHTLLHHGDLPFSPSAMPEVFTAFRRAVEKQSTPRPPLETPNRLHCPQMTDWGTIPTVAGLDLPQPMDDPRSACPFQGGETTGLRRLQHYIWEEQGIKTYKETRNALIGTEYSSKFSPWLAHGCLSPRRIYGEIKAFEAQVIANDSTYWLVFELLWRDYFRFLAEKVGDRLFALEGWHGRKPAAQRSPQALKLWTEGRTGEPFIDANLRELAATGFMSNRGRQNVASYWVHHLRQDWRAGASWFESRLLDYDPCSNWGNWAYLAGVGSDPRPDRVFNPESQAARYDPDGAYTRLWA